MNKFTYLYVLQGDYAHGWEDLTAETSHREIAARQREYEANAPEGFYRIIQRRERNE